MTLIRPSIAAKRRQFALLHETGCFLIPNPWDVGSALYLQTLGFKALASTSSGLAWSHGRPDNGLPRDAVLAHLKELVDATDIPVSADFENGFGMDAAGVEQSVKLAVASGVAGLSIEDSSGSLRSPLFELAEAVDRIRAARTAIDALGGEVLLVARAECFVVGLPHITHTVTRLQAYADAGADCLYAPGVRSAADISAIVAAVNPKPVNVLVSAPDDLPLLRIAELGVRRVSVGGTLARVAWGSFMNAARALAERASFEGFADIPAHGKLDALFPGG